MLVLGIETSCDETGAALVEDGKVLSNEVSSSVHLHSRYGGVIPEIASRFHTEYIYKVTEKALSDSGRAIGDIDLVAVTQGPGLPGSLLVGISFAKALSFALDIPLIGVDHLQAHMLSCFLGYGQGVMEESIYPFVGMVVSGGHTSIYYCEGLEDYTVLGRTRDDAVGEAFDKVAKVMDLGYPGGPVVEKRARGADPKKAILFPRALMKDENDLDFSFSGIKTAVMYYWRDCDRSDKEKDRICYSFQEAVVDVIVEKLGRAIRSTGAGKVAVGGGVVNNHVLREKLIGRCREEDAELFLPQRQYCADNAAMIAALGEALFSDGQRADLFLNATPGRS
ncbi:MAG: tRNA (adenosine(37)-N6)-threonylcarbamoyltransferase complex transferase subunit TsaD [Candidatus Omnitrophica bacterium]|nr:tRNA (adenosine(37)-N6)-threonylcarbamoyltransferase complex transferase subunit TsaD [Candidatus Omnitrophota bacterium]